MKITTTFSSAFLLAALTTPAWATPPTPTADQLQQISNCEIMAQAVQKFAEARDQGLSKPDAFKTVTHGQTDVPGSLVDETLQWAFAHPKEEPETVSDHFQERCQLDALDLLDPISEMKIQSDAVACQRDHEGKPDDIRGCIDSKLTAIVQAGGVPVPSTVTIEPTPVKPMTATPAPVVVPAASVPASSVAAVAPAPTPVATPTPVAVQAPAPVAAPAPVPVVASAPAPAVPPAVAPASVVAAEPKPVVVSAPVAPQSPAPVVAPASAPVVVAAAPAPAPVVASASTPVVAAPAPVPAPVVAAPAPTPVVAAVSPAPAPIAVKPAPAPAVQSAPILTVASTRPPSQPGIGKLTLGMSLAEAAKGFDSYGEQDEDADGSPNVSYMVSDDHGYVVLLTEPGKPDTVYGVEIHGGADAKLQPVMGVRLGDSALSLMTHIGEPTSRTPIPKSDDTLWSYNDRNYSFEVSSGGDVITIRVEGYTSLAVPSDTPAAATNP